MYRKCNCPHWSFFPCEPICRYDIGPRLSILSITSTEIHPGVHTDRQSSAGKCHSSVMHRKFCRQQKADHDEQQQQQGSRKPNTFDLSLTRSKVLRLKNCSNLGASTASYIHQRRQHLPLNIACPCANKYTNSTSPHLLIPWRSECSVCSSNSAAPACPSLRPAHCP